MPNYRFSLRTLLSWTALSALTLAYIRFLCQWFSPDTGFSSMPPSDALAEFVFESLPATATCVAATLVLILVPKRRWWLVILSMIAPIVFDVVVDRVIFNAIGYFEVYPRRASPLAGAERWAFQTGRITCIWMALTVATKLGGSFYLGSRRVDASGAR